MYSNMLGIDMANPESGGKKLSLENAVPMRPVRVGSTLCSLW